MKEKLLAAALCALCLLFLSCSPSEGQNAYTEDIEHPDMAFTRVVYTLGRSEFPPVQMNAAEMELYNDQNLALLHDVTFTQTDEDGNLLMSGTCQEARVNTSTYQTLLTGPVYIQRPQDKLAITGEDITWDNDKQRISTDKNVFLEYDSGSEIHGVGLSCDFRTSHYEFDQITEGRLMN